MSDLQSAIQRRGSRALPVRWRTVARAGAFFALLFAFIASTASARSDDLPPVRRALVVCGLPGDNEHRTQYAGATEKIVKALVERYGFAAKDIWVRFGTETKDGDGPALKASRGLSTRENLAADAEALRAATGAADSLWVIVLGHGHLDGRRAWLNLPGPDLSETQFARLFEGNRAKEQVFLITTSASGFFLKPLSAPGRIAISATEADQEVNETLFPLALAEVLESPPPEADRDKDGTLSVFELYLATVANVMKRYAEEEDIPTEHAQLDDNGDGHGSEVQVSFLPPESGGEAEPEKGKGKSKSKRSEKPEPVLGPKDDGYLASHTRLTPAPAGAAATAGPESRTPEAAEPSDR